MKQIYLLIFIATLTVARELHYACDDDEWIMFNKNCYKKSTKHTRWKQAERLCGKENSNLVNIHSKNEEIFIKNTFKQVHWIGLQSLPFWEWQDKKPYVYSNFEIGTPSVHRNCVAIKSASSKWVDKSCNNKFRSICRKGSKDKCLSTGKRYKESCFIFDDVKRTWKEAKQNCSSNGGYLADIRNKEENNFIYSNWLKQERNIPNAKFWIGLTKKRRWKESDDRYARYTNFEESSLIGIGNCISKSKNKWSAQPCDQKLSYICQTRGSNCSSSSITFGNKCLHKNSQKKSWYAANKSCADSGGLLLNIEDALEDQFITSSNLKMQNDMWLGHHIKPTLVWTDKTPLDFNHFEEGFPSGVGGCIAMKGNLWKDMPCNVQLKFVCKTNSTENCKENWVRNSSFCYLFNGTRSMNWYDAEATCELDSAHLVSVKSLKELDFISKICQGSCWLGLHEKRSELKWSDESSVAYIQSQVNSKQNYACFSKSKITHQSFLLKHQCLRKLPYICKKPAKVFCPQQSLPIPFTTGINVTFPETEPGYQTVSNEKCPSKGTVYATRLCQFNSTWQQPHWVSSCNISIQALNKVKITENNVEEISADLVLLTSKSNSSRNDAVNLVEKCMLFKKASDHKVSSSLVDVLSNLLDGNPSETTKKRVPKILRKLAIKVNLTKGSFFKVSSRISIYVFYSEKNISRGIKVLNFKKNHEKVFYQNQVQRLERAPQTNQFSYIFVNSKSSNKYSRTIFSAFVDTSILKSKDSRLKTKINSDIILSASLINSTIYSVVTHFKIEKLEGGNSKCVFWDESRQIWSQYGIKTNQVTNEYIHCSANHLTNFASLFVYNKTYKSLSMLTLIGCSISLVCQVLTLIFCLFSKRKQEAYHHTRRFMQCNLTFALSLLNSLLIVSEIPPIKKSVSSCTNTAVLLHISLLSVFFWMFIDTLNIYIATNHPMYYRRKMNTTKIQAVALFSGWGIPVWIVVTCKVSNREIYENYNQQCWISLDWILYLVIIPTSIVVFINVILFSLILRKTKFKKQNEKQTSKNETARTVNFALILFMLIGGTWICGFLITHMYNVSERAGFGCSVVFAVLNFLQGVVLFLLYYVRRPGNQAQVSRSQVTRETQNF